MLAGRGVRKKGKRKDWNKEKKKKKKVYKALRDLLLGPRTGDKIVNTIFPYYSRGDAFQRGQITRGGMVFEK